ncbi:MBL fold metallo-hydrolase [Breoghania sp.]|uniref:MBL fold metallo-hydrolase n=1 Tax=Breoghania sp. TaxID=2065378 RepID=UPI0026045F3F|nr:MBL fold metallo-hydrolase [Breoghania sp.]MDJ0932356.1 MBL fold metallo-hydrolase [Breoghania sp.]
MTPAACRCRFPDCPGQARNAEHSVLSLVHNRTFEPRYGEAVALSPLVARMTAPNASPFTFHGTNTYLVGERDLAVIDPGPEDEGHIRAILAATAGRSISHIVVTHTHRDHSPGARLLKAHTGAPIVGAAEHRPARPLNVGEINPLDAGGDTYHVADWILSEGEVLEGDSWSLETVETPGHTANHLAFALTQEGSLFSGDHVMAWSTSIVAPPDGTMADYMASLDRLMARAEQRYYPGHGGTVEEAQAYVAALKKRRQAREAAVLERIRAGDAHIPEMVKIIYRNVDPILHGPAALSVLAHVEDLVARGVAVCEGPPSLMARYELA